MTQIEEFCANPSSELSHEQIQNVVMFLSHSKSLAKHVDSFIRMLYLLQLKECTPYVLAPIVLGDLSEVDSFWYFSIGDLSFSAIPCISIHQHILGSLSVQLTC